MDEQSDYYVLTEYIANPLLSRPLAIVLVIGGVLLTLIPAVVYMQRRSSDDEAPALRSTAQRLTPYAGAAAALVLLVSIAVYAVNSDAKDQDRTAAVTAALAQGWPSIAGPGRLVGDVEPTTVFGIGTPREYTLSSTVHKDCTAQLEDGPAGHKRVYLSCGGNYLPIETSTKEPHRP